MKQIYRLYAILVALFLSLDSLASIDEYYLYPIKSSASNFGNTGLYDTPNARVMSPASLRINFSSSYPFEYTSLTATPFSWVEATYRYTEIKNKKYGQIFYSGNQSLKDKGFYLKVLIHNEKKYLPALAIGLRDIAGTGLFSSEYIVTTKRLGSFDLSAGLGWGLLGSADNVSNPFENFDDSFMDRNSVQG